MNDRNQVFADLPDEVNAMQAPGETAISKSGSPTPEQARAIAHESGNAYVGAGPGTGKTFLLIERLRELLRRGVSPDRIVVLTFSRRAKSELRARLQGAGLADSAIDVRTFHGFAARVAGGGLARFRELRLLDDFSRRLALETAIANTSTPTLAPRSRSSESFIEQCLSLVEDLGRIDEATLKLLENAASQRLRDILAIRNRFVDQQRTLGGGDLGDLVSRAISESGRVGSPAQTWLAGRYDHVLVDEFQDTDREQLKLLEHCGAEIFAVGDEAQSIYRFRGASDAIVPYAIRHLAMRRYDLTVSRRCPPAVCELASKTPLPELAPLHSAFVNGAPVAVNRYATVDAEAFAIADAVERDIDDGRPQNEIAILLRAFRPLGPLVVAELRRRSITVATAGPDAMMADECVATLIAALMLFDAPADRTRWADLLASPPLRLDALAIRYLATQTAPLRLDDALATTLAGVMPAQSERIRSICSGLLAAHAAWSAGDLALAARRIVRRMGLVAAVLRDASPASVRAIAGRLKIVCDALADAQRTSRALGLPNAPADIVKRLDDIIAALRPDPALDAPGVRILSIHGAKGLEFQRVFVADAVQGRFPREPRKSSLLSDDDRALLLDRGIDGVNVAPDGAIREEMSLWFVAVTRCSERLSISFAERDLSGSAQRPSRFLAGRADIPATHVPTTSLVVRALEQSDESVRERLVAACVVGEIPVVAALAREGTSAFQPYHGPRLTRSRTFSVSEATEWLRCPRMVFYGRMLKLPQEESASLHVGSALHDVLMRFHDVHRFFDGQGDYVEEWTRELQALLATHWDASNYRTEAISMAAKRSADVALRAYAIALGSYAKTTPFTVEEREYDVSIPVGPFSLRGRIDRLDRLADGTRVIIDYKSGAAKPTPVKEAEKVANAWSDAALSDEPPKSLIGAMPKDLDLQLAFYATAIENVKTIAKIYLAGNKDAWKRAGIAAIDACAFEGVLETVARGALAELEREALVPLATDGIAFVPVASDEKTCEYCAYVTICPGPVV